MDGFGNSKVGGVLHLLVVQVNVAFFVLFLLLVKFYDIFFYTLWLFSNTAVFCVFFFHPAQL